MLVQVGPVASSSVSMWVAYARTVLGQTMAHLDRSPVDGSLLEQFELLIDEWDTSARASTELVWTADMDIDTIERFARSFYALVSGLATEAEDRGYPISPPEGDEFYWTLVNAMLGALTTAGGDRAEVAAQLARQWPGRKDDAEG